jgi:hypothetical protein
LPPIWGPRHDAVMHTQDHDRLAAIYHHFADREARGRSPLYETLAHAIAGDEETLSRLLTLPPAKRQPNLVLAAARLVAGVQADWPRFRDALRTHWPDIEAVILTRSTQTNEPNRCAALLPILAGLKQPLALIEVGASAGLCLLLDRYAYNYGGHRVRAADAHPDAPEFCCTLTPDTHRPEAVPRIAWRAGLDLNPLSVNDPDQMAWLETLVWPEQTDRTRRLKAAIRIARIDPPRIVKGDLLKDLRPLIDEAPEDATLVIFHTAVLDYIRNETDREAFATSMASACDTWISNEGARVFPSIATRLSTPIKPGRFLLSVNGQPVAAADPHGVTLDWLG